MSGSSPTDENMGTEGFSLIFTVHQLSGWGEFRGTQSGLVFGLQSGHRGFTLLPLKGLRKRPPGLGLGHPLYIIEIAPHRSQSEVVRKRLRK